MAKNKDRIRVDEKVVITPGVDVTKLKKEDKTVGKKKAKTTAL